MFLCTTCSPYCIFHLPVLYPSAFYMDTCILLHKKLSLENLIIIMVTLFLFHLKAAAAILKWSSLLPGSRQRRKWGEADLELGRREWVACNHSFNSGLLFRQSSNSTGTENMGLSTGSWVYGMFQGLRFLTLLQFVWRLTWVEPVVSALEGQWQDEDVMMNVQISASQDLMSAGVIWGSRKKFEDLG